LSVVPKKVLQALVFALPLCVVGFAVLMGGASLMRAMDDAAGALALAWIAAAFLLAGVADGLLLVIVLGLRALDEKDESTRGEG
jgi:hypothetical protein